ncbi:Ig-like domain-containing protein [Streptomyces sp. NPDC059639]|uniref:Ig-like domain-containing protein n=1 Tax=Streptomyces sp. NPDC059639 TaxID=3346891 RepID=UPI0036C25007
MAAPSRPRRAFAAAPRGGALLAALTLTLAALPAALSGGARAASGDPVSSAAQGAVADCAEPTRTLTGGSSQALTFTSDETVLLTSGTYQGGINAYPAGATVCVAPDATFAPSYLNNPMGALVVDGTARLPYVTASGGFILVNRGTTTAEGFTADGTALVENTDDATLDLPNSLALRGNSMLINSGTMTAGSVTVAANSQLANRGTLTEKGSGFALDGTFTNTGTASITNYLNASGTSRLDNACRITTGQGWANAGTAVNSGVITLKSEYLNNSGTLSQNSKGRIVGADFTNGGTVTGYGGYRFTGNTTNFGTFRGDAADTPVSFWDTSSTGAVFDTTGGTVENVVRAEVTVDDGETPSGCAGRSTTGAATPTADLYVYKSGPAEVTTGDTVTYKVNVSNLGPDTAEDVVVTDRLPDGLADVSASDGGTVAADATKVTWNVGSLSDGAVRTFTVTGRAAAEGTLLDVASGTSSTADPDAANNDGSSTPGRVTTTVTGPVAVNHAPALDDEDAVTTAYRPATGTLTASDPDDGQTLTYLLPGATREGGLRVTSARGTLTLEPDGRYTYTPKGGFTGNDVFRIEVCDNGSPVLCDTAKFTVTVRPVARDDRATVTESTPYSGDVTYNDVGDTSPPEITDPARHGKVTDNGDGTYTYTPDAGYTGTDTVGYRICSPTAPTVCATAVVHLTVVPEDRPPLVGDDTETIRTGETAAGSVEVSDPQGSEVEVGLGTGPRHGTVTVRPDGSFVYTPDDGWTGTDTFTVIGCESAGRKLCATGTVTIDVLAQKPPTPTQTSTVAPTPTPSPSVTSSGPAPSATGTASGGPVPPTAGSPGPTPPTRTASPAPGGGPGLAATGSGTFLIALGWAAGIAAAAGTLILLLARRARRH